MHVTWNLISRVRQLQTAISSPLWLKSERTTHNFRSKDGEEKRTFLTCYRTAYLYILASTRKLKCEAPDSNSIISIFP